MKNLLNPKLIFIALLSLGLLFMKACSDDDNVTSNEPEPEPEETLADVLTNDDSYSTLVSLVPDNLLSDLQNEELTVFAPTNAAFEAIPSDVLNSLTEDQVELIITYHLVAGTTLSGDIPSQTDVETVQGELLLLQSNNGVFVNGDTEVVAPDLTADNGVVHGIDQVLLPSDIRKALGETNIIDVAEEAGGFETLLGAVESTGLKTTLQFLEPFTVFAPNDDAFAALPEGTLESLTADQLTQILTYHALDSEVFAGDLESQQAPASLNGEELYISADDGSVTINGNSNVVAADIEATNGVIHVVDSVLLPDAFGTVVDNAIKRFDFNTLVNAVVDADLADALQAEGPFTVFAPTDDAIAELPDGLLASLSMEDLQEVLLYHVIGADIKSGDLEEQQSPNALSEEALYITAGDGVTVNGSSSVIAADVDASNGTIHAIDQVLLPNKFLNVVEIAQKNYDLTTLVNLVVDADLAGTLSGDGPFTIFAPVNSAFDEISDTLEGLSEEEVSDVLTYHVIPDLIKSGDIPEGTTEIGTVNGAEVTIVNDSGSVTVNGESVITVDLEGTNGVIHLIDGVLIP
ncbi:MAG: fasciclin domain-containing protein [Balneolaceae bacterium]|nr:fasciclin domain-containing protein [Balneolaceae bacterium]